MRWMSQRVLYAAAFAFLLLYVFPYQARLNNPNENVRLYMTAALVEEGTYAIDGMRKRWGWVNDAATRDGHVYSVKAPGSSWLGVPGYAAYLVVVRLLGGEFDRTVALWVCRVTATIVPTWLWLVWLWGWFDRQTRHAPLRDAALVSVGFGSLLYGYGLLFVSHTLSAAAAFTAFALLHDAARSERSVSSARAFWIGTLSAWVTVLEYPGVVASLVLVLYAVRVMGFGRPLLWLALGGTLPTLAMMHFQWSAFGSPFSPGHLMVENDAFRAAHEQGLYGAVGPSWSSLHGLLFDLGAGLFPLTPLLALGVVGCATLLRGDRPQRVAAWVAIALCALTLLSIASMNNWRGGWTIGPRYLAVVVPFLAWAALDPLSRWAERWPRAIYSVALGLAMVGLVASGTPSVYYPHLPPEFTRPLPQLIGLLLSHDYAPLNAGTWLGVNGTLSMVPLALVALGLVFGSVFRATGLRSGAVVAVASAVAASVLAAPLLAAPEEEPGVPQARAFVTRRWTPSGLDRAASIEEKLAKSDSSGLPSGRVEGLLRELVSTYREEGRFQEADRTDRRTR